MWMFDIFTAYIFSNEVENYFTPYDNCRCTNFIGEINLSLVIVLLLEQWENLEIVMI